MSTRSVIEHQLRERFARPGKAGRIVIWSDPQEEHAELLDTLDLPGVTVLRLDGNDFSVKRRVLSTQPKDPFLLYRQGPRPNWLLDLELAYGLFTADTASLIAQELGGGPVLREIAERYPEFFQSPECTQALKQRLNPEDDITDITAMMIAVLLGTEERSLSALWRALLTENAADSSEGIDEIERLGLADFHWQGTRRIYGYDAETPSVDDFVLWLFTWAWEQFAPSSSTQTSDEYRNIRRDFSTWSNDNRFADTYRILAERAAEELDIDTRAAEISLPELMGRFTFPGIDRQIIHELVDGVSRRTLPDQDVQDAVRRRSAGLWSDEFREHYKAISAASSFLARVETLSLAMAGPGDGFQRYTQEWYAIDQAYRQFTWHAGRAEPEPSLEALRPRVEAAYTTDYLASLAKAWQQQVDTMDRWRIHGVPSATSFFTEQVQRRWLDRNNKVTVIVSDALRYEVAEELGRCIREKDRFTAELSAMLGVLPSYTQLGMAALLPHQSLSFADGTKGMVEVDGRPSDGTKNRAEILEPSGGTAIQAQAFTRLTPSEARELVKSHRVLYIYHNQIDAVGDKGISEGHTFRACEETISELIGLVKKLANANVNNILITADHGFLYQERPLEEPDYLSETPHGDALLFTNHRFVLGRSLKRSRAFTTFTPGQLSMTGDIEAQVPRANHRIRLPGSGVRYVHGGAALQEIVVPVVAVNKRRTSDTRQVAVRIMAQTDRITTGQITVVLYQEEPVTEKVKPRTLIAGLYGGDTLISNEVTVTCTQTSEQSRDRTYPVTLVLSSDADDFNGQNVELRLFEPVGSSGRRPYPDRARFLLRRTFGSDFGQDF